MMKIKKGYLMRQVIDTYIVVPVGEQVIEFKGMMTLNKTGAFIWQQLQTEQTYEQILAAVLDKYEIGEATAAADLKEFLDSARGSGVLEE